MIRKSYKNRGYRQNDNMNAIKWYIDSQLSDIKTNSNINPPMSDLRVVELEELYKNLSIKVDKMENYMNKDTGAIRDIKASNKEINDKVNNIVNTSLEFMATKIDNLIISDVKNSENINKLLQNNMKHMAEFTKNNEQLLQSLNILLEQKLVSNHPANPSLETQSAETQSAETQSAETQSAETPSAETPSAETPT